MGDEAMETTVATAEEAGTTDLLEDQEFNDAFDEKPAEEKAPDTTKDEEKPAEETPSKGDEKPPTVEEQLAALTKRLDDQQASFTRVSQENAELRKQLASKDSSVSDDTDIPEEIKTLMDDYPEFTKLIDYFMKKSGGGGDPDIKSSIEQYQQQRDFESAVMSGYANEAGEWVDGHPDAIKIFNSKGFMEFCQSKKIDASVTVSKAIELITEYKKNHLRQAASQHDTTATEKGKKVTEALTGGVRSTRTAGRSAESTDDKDDFDKAWAED